METVVHLILSDADHSGVVTANLDHWTGKAFGIPIDDLTEMKDPLNSVGVYVLVGERTADHLPVIYIGQTENVANRLNKNHQALNRPDVTWRRVVIVVSQTTDFNKVHACWVEAKLVERARTTGKWTLLNTVTPSVPQLSWRDEISVQSFLENMLVLYPFLGVEAFQQPPVRHETLLPAHTERANCVAAAGVVREAEFTLKLGGEVVATGHPSAGGFTICQGSKLKRKESATVGRGVSDLRKRWVENSTVSEYDENWFVLNADVELSASSAAAEAVTGRSASGPKEWATPEGRKLKEIRNATDGFDV
jgi:hypothetical protein